MTGRKKKMKNKSQKTIRKVSSCAFSDNKGWFAK